MYVEGSLRYKTPHTLLEYTPHATHLARIHTTTIHLARIHTTTTHLAR